MIPLKKSVRSIAPYDVNDKPCKVKLDANEGSNYLLNEKIVLEQLRANQYPDSDANRVREQMAEYYHCKKENILCGNGSSELINMTINAYCESGDQVLTFAPGFSMYEIYCKLCGAELVQIKAEDDFTQDMQKLIEKAKESKPKIVILCNPNNPTGFVNPKEEVLQLLEVITDSLIIVDEAYGDFVEESVLPYMNTYENLVVMRTMSKAFGLANLRVGALIGNEEVIKELWKVKTPYNLNGTSQLLAELALNNRDKVKNYIEEVKQQREVLCNAFTKMQLKVYASGANFIFLEIPIERFAEKLFEKGIAIRGFEGALRNYYRITIGTPKENLFLIGKMQEIIA